MNESIRFDFLTYDCQYPNFDFESYLSEKQIDFRKVEADDHVEWCINCPMCTERGEPTLDLNKKLWTNINKAKFHCYRCKWSGPLTRLVQKLSNVRLVEALKVLRGEQLDPMDYMNLRLYEERYEFGEDEDEIREVELPYGYEPIEGSQTYLSKRGIPWKYAENHDWGYSNVGYTKGRIIVPTFMDGRLVYWQARATWEGSGDKDFRKVLNPKGVSARSILYNYDIAKQYDEIVVVEGFIDAVKVGPNAVATNGKRLHPEQVEWLRKTNAKKIVMCWDADSWTDHAYHRTGPKKGQLKKACTMRQAVDLLRTAGLIVKCAKMPEGRDPGSYPYKSESLKQIIKSAKRPKFPV